MAVAAQPSVIFLGDFSNERICWNELADHLGWTVCFAPDSDALGATDSGRNVRAVFIDYDVRGKLGTGQIKRVRARFAEARVVVCCALDSIGDLDLAEIGAFHAVARPLKIDEVWRSMGFVSQWWKALTERLHFAAAA